jgi:hypothetical protein
MLLLTANLESFSELHMIATSRSVCIWDFDRYQLLTNVHGCVLTHDLLVTAGQILTGNCEYELCLITRDPKTSTILYAALKAGFQPPGGALLKF